MKHRLMQEQPTPVPIGAKQVGEIRARWAWAEASVWTDRMLTALENGVNGELWFSLIDKVIITGWTRTLKARAGNLLCTKVKINGTDAGWFVVDSGTDVAISGITPFLLDHHAAANGANSKGITPLMAAAIEGNAEAVQMLLRDGADPTLKSREGKTAIQYGTNAAILAALGPAEIPS